MFANWIKVGKTMAKGIEGPKVLFNECEWMQPNEGKLCPINSVAATPPFGVKNRNVYSYYTPRAGVRVTS